MTAEFLRHASPRMHPLREKFIQAATDRIRSAGAEQYYDRVTGKMAFETLSEPTLVTYLEEELLDAANYLAMLAWIVDDEDDVKDKTLQEITRDVLSLYERARELRGS